MTLRTASRTVLQYVSVITLALALISCTNHHARKHTKAKVPEAYAFLSDMAVAKLSLEENPAAESKALTSQLASVEAFTNQKEKKETRQPVILLSYKLKGQSDQHQVAVPYIMPVEKAPFTALRRTLNILKADEYTLYDIKTGVIFVTPGEPLGFDNATNNDIHSMLEDRTNELAGDIRPLPPLAEAKVQMYLARFFMEKRVRDAAYLAMENAKHALAAVSDKNDPETKALTHKLGALESELRKTLPFTLSAS